MNELRGTEGTCPSEAGEREGRAGVSEEGDPGNTPGAGANPATRPPAGDAPAAPLGAGGATPAERGGESGTAASHRPLLGAGSRKGPSGRKRESVSRPVASHPRRPLPSGCGKSGRGRRCALCSGRARPRRRRADEMRALRLWAAGLVPVPGLVLVLVLVPGPGAQAGVGVRGE